jgi:hypothetical protein
MYTALYLSSLAGSYSLIGAASGRLVSIGAGVDDERLLLTDEPSAHVGSLDLGGAPSQGIALEGKSSKRVLSRIKPGRQLSLGKVRRLLDVHVQRGGTRSDVLDKLPVLNLELAGSSMALENCCAGNILRNGL